MISGADLSRNPKYNKGLAFTEIERDRLYLRGLLPPAILSQDVQVGYHDAGLPYQHHHIKQQLDKHWLLAFKALLYLSFAPVVRQRKGSLGPLCALDNRPRAYPAAARNTICHWSIYTSFYVSMPPQQQLVPLFHLSTITHRQAIHTIL